MIEVVSAVIVQRARLLLTQRPANKDFPFCWETPGGKVERDESHHQALRRELAEELGLEGSVVHYINEYPLWTGSVVVPEKGEVSVSLYLTTIVDGARPQPLEWQGIGWFALRQLGALPLAPANALAYYKLVSLLAASGHHEGE